MANFNGGVGQSLRQGMKARDRSGSDDNLSKIVELNGKYRIFFRKFLLPDPDTGELTEDSDIRTAVVPGRLCDLKMCGTAFIPYNSDMLEYNADTGSFKDLTNLESWTRIARVLFEAQCIREKKNAEAEAARTAKELDRPIDQMALQKALDKIELEYHGGEGADEKPIMPTKQPAFSGIKWKVSTRIAVVKLGPTGAPDWKNAKYATYEVGKTKSELLLSLLEKPEYCSVSKDYLEVGYDYMGSDKKSAGQSATFQGIADNLSLESLYHDEWEKFGKKFIEGIITATDEDSIVAFLRARNRSLKGGGDIKGAIESFKKWCATNQAVFGSINFEDEFTSRAAADFLESHLLDGLNSVKEKMTALAEEANKKKDQPGEEGAASTAATEEKTEEPAAGDGKSLASIMAEQEAAEQNAMKQIAENANMTEAEQSIRNIAASGMDIDDSGDLGDL